VREYEGAPINQPVKAGYDKQAAFLQPPAFQAGCHEPSFNPPTIIVFVMILSNRSSYERRVTRESRKIRNKQRVRLFSLFAGPETAHALRFPGPPLTAKPVDNSGFPWMGVEIRLTSGASGRRYVIIPISLQCSGRIHLQEVEEIISEKPGSLDI